MKPSRTPRHASLAAAACVLATLAGTANGQVYYAPGDDASRYRYADENDAQYQQRLNRYNQRQDRYFDRQEQRRRANPGPNLPSMEQQRSDQESAVSDAYARQRESSLSRGPARPAQRFDAPRQLGR